MSGHDHGMPKACYRTLLATAKLLLLDNLDQSVQVARCLHDCDGAPCDGRRPCQAHVARLLAGLNMAEMLSYLHRARVV